MCQTIEFALIYCKAADAGDIHPAMEVSIVETLVRPRHHP
jgi:hypothetical protein